MIITKYFLNGNYLKTFLREEELFQIVSKRRYSNSNMCLNLNIFFLVFYCYIRCGGCDEVDGYEPEILLQGKIFFRYLGAINTFLAYNLDFLLFIK